MSAVKIKFAGFLRGLLRRFEDDKPFAEETVAAAPAAVPHPADLRQSEPADFTPPAAPGKPIEIQLPITPILTGLPLDLRAKIVGANTVGMMISLPVDKVLAQLATGSVKITFGELRHLAPGVFASFGGECDAKPVTLPLNQILAQLNPALLARRAAQKQTSALSDEITSPFNTSGAGLTISAKQPKTSPAEPASAPIPMPRRAPVSEAPFSPPIAQPPSGFTPRWTLPAASTPASRASATSISTAAVPPAAALSIPPMAALPEQSQPTISAPLVALAECWPEPLQKEIKLMGLMNAEVELPIHLVEPALKRGRVIFSWRSMRSWIKSAPTSAVSVNDSLELELPLKVLAPLFVNHKNGSAKFQKKTAVADDIPNLFFGFPQPNAAARPTPPATPTANGIAAPRPPDTNFFNRSNQPQTTDSEFKRKGGTDFMSRAATPSEIVFRALELPAVAGAIIALPDGLKVACQISQDLNGDTLAAFIPQIFSRVNQCSHELRMGEMNNLSFTVGNVPWKIFRVNAVYFAAFGHANESLPSAQLAALAGELDRKKV
jgi:predicted regulator of Ras-like GTPase activity (Roadblock/LC7/MglB family)